MCKPLPVSVMSPVQSQLLGGVQLPSSADTMVGLLDEASRHVETSDAKASKETRMMSQRETWPKLVVHIICGAADWTMLGSLLFIDLASTKPFIFGLRALSLSTLETSLMLNLGPGESFYDQVSTAGAGTYYATVQHPGPPIDPWVPSRCDGACINSTCCADPSSPSAGFCLAVQNCSQINGGHREWEETLAVTLPTSEAPHATLSARFGPSDDCYKLAIVSPGEVLCIASGTNGSKALIGLRRLYVEAKTSELVAWFPPQADGIWNQAAAYDPTRHIFYAFLGDDNGENAAVHAMDAKTGELLPTRAWPSGINVADFAIDASGEAYAAISERTSDGWRQMLARLHLAPASQPITWEPANPAATDAFGRLVAGKCQPGTGPGAAKRCYDQLNNAFTANGTFFITAFSHVGPGAATPEAVLGVDVRSGAVTLEHAHNNSNMIDMAWMPWDAAVHAASATDEAGGKAEVQAEAGAEAEAEVAAVAKAVEPLRLAFHARYIGCANFSDPIGCAWYGHAESKFGSPSWFGSLNASDGRASPVEGLSSAMLAFQTVGSTNIVMPATGSGHLLWVNPNATARSLAWLPQRARAASLIPVVRANGQSESALPFPPVWQEVAELENRSCLLAWRRWSVKGTGTLTQKVSELLECVDLEGVKLPSARLSARVVYQNTSTVPSGALPPPAFGDERAIDRTARLLYAFSHATSATGSSIARFDLGASSFLSPLPVAGEPLRCLHYDGSARRLGALTWQEDLKTLTLVSIDTATGNVTARLTLPPLPTSHPAIAPVFSDGDPARAPVCSFSSGSGQHVMLFAAKDSAAKYRYLANELVYANVLDTRNLRWLGMRAIYVPLGDPPSPSQAWRAVNPSLSFVDS